MAASTSKTKLPETGNECQEQEILNILIHILHFYSKKMSINFRCKLMHVSKIFCSTLFKCTKHINRSWSSYVLILLRTILSSFACIIHHVYIQSSHGFLLLLNSIWSPPIEFCHVIYTRMLKKPQIMP